MYFYCYVYVFLLLCMFYSVYHICSRNLGTFFSILAAEKSGCVKYADIFVEVLIWVLF